MLCKVCSSLKVLVGCLVERLFEGVFGVYFVFFVWSVVFLLRGFLCLVLVWVCTESGGGNCSLFKVRDKWVFLDSVLWLSKLFAKGWFAF